jgi:hypothetical protein
MTRYRRFIPPRIPIEPSTAASVLTPHKAARLRIKKQGQLQVALDQSEGEGGSVASTDVAA